MSTTCTLADSTGPSLQLRRYDGNASADFGGGAGLFPVQLLQIDFGAGSNPSGEKTVSMVCPGTKFSLAALGPFSRYRIETVIQALQLANYRAFDVGADVSSPRAEI